MTLQPLNFFAWLAGLLCLVLIVWLSGWEDFIERLKLLRAFHIFSWVTITLCLRFLMAETLLLPVRALGFRLTRMQAFWLGWVRTFFNQVIPVSGAAYSAVYLNRAAGMRWSEIAALVSPQFLLAAETAAILGAVATIFCSAQLGGAAAPVLGGFVGLGLLAMAANSRAILAFGWLPAGVRERFSKGIEFLSKYRKEKALILKLAVCHLGVFICRATRLWVLFVAVGAQVTLAEAILFSAAGSLTLIIQVTPGGLGLREGALLGVGLLMGLDVRMVASVAVLDRLLMVAIISVLTPPAIWQLQGRWQP